MVRHSNTCCVGNALRRGRPEVRTIFTTENSNVLFHIGYTQFNLACTLIEHVDQDEISSKSVKNAA
jgi:hypothetical protein